MLRVLDLFSGLGGFSLGLERTGGFRTVAFCEIEEFPRKVLRKHWPDVPIFEDVTNADFEPVGPVDLVTAGFPCQDISLAGKGAGLTGERSGLFWHILRTVRMVGRPQLLLENVAELLNRGLGAVLGALAQIGYDAEWHCIPASAVGAPHVRDRVWIMAHPNKERSSSERGKRQDLSEEGSVWRNEFGRGQSVIEWQKPIRGARQTRKGADSNSPGSEGQQSCGADQKERPRPLSGPLGPLLASHRGKWPTEPDLPRVANGLPDQSHRIAALGNSVVPRIPEMIGRAILEAEGQT